MKKQIKLSQESIKLLIDAYKEWDVLLEGNILKFINTENLDEEEKQYLKDAVRRDSEQKRRHLSITERVSRQNAELAKVNDELQQAIKDKDEAIVLLEKQTTESIKAKHEADYARLNAERDLEIELRKSKNEKQGNAILGLILLLILIVLIFAALVMILRTDTAFQAFATLCTAIVGAVVSAIGFYFKIRDDNNKTITNENRKLMV